MKLYIYDHCPFCIRARMILGLRDVPLENIVLLNDDEDTPIGLIGAKQVPILQKPDGSHMGESLDIVRYIDEFSGCETRLNETIRPEIQAWFDRFMAYGNHLIQPRDIQIGLPEFATPEAIAYFQKKKESMLGSFEQNLTETSKYLAQAEQELAQLDTLVKSSGCLNGENLSMEDIIIFPLLRNLSIVKGIQYPQNVLAYVQTMAEKAKIDTYFDRAI
ncbi:GrxB family glutaredoxin [Kingella negevensis]|uniref:GrxB family glutaredoxin n=1 Tax=Kingella negevensis TaxID=1522312 RepID=UPI00050A1C77|nr:GrxB family glutaredoxin [Kingella negevensis]MDK4684523.1 GrxB family glutaredoxin [Kingella negevensis]MDK4688571.1 GrxB family glutaredoxin [Kingella negevensis]MDK4696523.1 GrxB family glutaredoxin [Kingella negevensis]MDK4707455.1 GrxB family glutaredoxin [Kingella negevensis]MDK4710069.1 GrxB family glutaredoxin [Kingella negevensis]